MSTSDRDPFADNPELEHARTVPMTAIPVHRPDGPGQAPSPQSGGGGGKGKWIVLIVVVLLLVGGGATAAVLLLGGDGDEDAASEADDDALEANEATPDEASDEPAADMSTPEPSTDAPAEVEAPSENTSPTAEIAEAPANTETAEPVEPHGVLVTPPTAEELAAAEAIGNALTEAGDDHQARRALAQDPANARALVVLAATTDDPVLAALALQGMRTAHGQGPNRTAPDADFVATVMRWTDVTDGVEWRTLAPAIEAFASLSETQLESEAVTARLVGLVGHDADPAVQLEMLRAMPNYTVVAQPALSDAIVATLDSPQPAVVGQAAFLLNQAIGLPPAARRRVVERSRQLLTTHADPGVRGYALELWARHGEGDEAPTMTDVLPFLTDSHPFVRSVALDQLATYGAPEVIHVLVPLLADSTPNTHLLEALREGGPIVAFDGGVWSRVDDNAIKAIATASSSLPTPFVCAVEARQWRSSLGQCREAARTWYDEHIGDIAPLVVEYEPVSNAPQPPDTLPEPPEGLPQVETSLAVGQRVLAAHAGRGGKIGLESGWMLVPGAQASLVRTQLDQHWVPNALVAPLSAGSGDEDQAQPGHLVVTDKRTVRGPMLIVEGGTPAAPMAVDPARLGAEPTELEPGAFRVVREALEPGTQALVEPADGGKRASLVEVVQVIDEQVVVVDGGAVRTVARDAVTGFPPAPDVEAGDEVQVVDTFGRLTTVEVVSVDSKTGIVEVGQKGVEGATKVAPGRFLPAP